MYCIRDNFFTLIKPCNVHIQFKGHKFCIKLSAQNIDPQKDNDLKKLCTKLGQCTKLNSKIILSYFLLSTRPSKITMYTVVLDR